MSESQIQHINMEIWWKEMTDQLLSIISKHILVAYVVYHTEKSLTSWFMRWMHYHDESTLITKGWDSSSLAAAKKVFYRKLSFRNVFVQDT